MMWQKLKPRIWKWRGIIFAVPSITALVIGLRLTGLLQLLELAALDQFFLLRPSEPPDQRIVIIEINEPDIRKQGQWPMSDAALANLLEKIKQQQPSAIGLDVYRDLPVNPGHQALLKVFESTPNLIGVQKFSDTIDSSAVKDLFYTPYSSHVFTDPERMAGVTIHANLISQILSTALDGRTLIKTLPEPVEWLSILIWSIIGATLCWQERYSSNQKALIVVSLAGGGLVGGSFLAFMAGWWIPVVPSLLAFGGSAIALIQYIAQGSAEMRKTLGRYLSDEILANIPTKPGNGNWY